MPEGWSVGTTVVEGWGEVPRAELGLSASESSMDQDSSPRSEHQREVSVPRMLSEPSPPNADL